MCSRASERLERRSQLPLPQRKLPSPRACDEPAASQGTRSRGKMRDVVDVLCSWLAPPIVDGMTLRQYRGQTERRRHFDVHVFEIANRLQKSFVNVPDRHVVGHWFCSHGWTVVCIRGIRNPMVRQPLRMLKK